jgi:sulfur carrier protein ThiS
MRIYLNGKEIILAEGMQVRHAITSLTGEATDFSRWVVRDRWGNSIGMDGALRDGEIITAEWR